MKKLEDLGDMTEQEALDLCVELAESLTFDDYIAMVERTIGTDRTLAGAVEDVCHMVRLETGMSDK